MGREGYKIHQIQASSVDAVHDKAILRNVEALFWLAPPSTAFPVIRQLLAEAGLPLIILGLFDPGCDEDDFNCLENCFVIDHQDLGLKRAEFFIKRGDRRIAYAGPYWLSEYIGFGEALRKQGIPYGPEDCVEDSVHTVDLLRELLSKNRYTALSAEGGNDRVRQVFEAVASLPETRRPDILIRYTDPRLLDYIKQYPQLNVLGTEVTEHGRIGLAAAEMMIRHLKENEPLHGMKIPAVSIHENIEEYIENQGAEI